jgi:hypothetical protein
LASSSPHGGSSTRYLEAWSNCGCAPRSKLRGIRIKINRFKPELDQAEAEKTRADAEISRAKLENFQGTLKIREEKVSILKASFHQLAKKLPPALPPGEEEIKAKLQWKFWRTG